MGLGFHLVNNGEPVVSREQPKESNKSAPSGSRFKVLLMSSKDALVTEAKRINEELRGNLPAIMVASTLVIVGVALVASGLGVLGVGAGLAACVIVLSICVAVGSYFEEQKRLATEKRLALMST